MITASVAHQVASALKLASGIAHAFPESHIGLFIAGIDEGGDEAGSSLDKFSEFSQTLGEGLSITGEILGVYANQQRMAEDWQLQLSTAKSDVEQILQQTAAATRQLAIAERDLEIVQQQITQNESVTAFMRDKFANAQLYDWMSGQLSGLYLQAYQMAYDMAKSAERAFQFERAVGDGEVAFIRPVYWDSRRNGLLAGETLGLDLQRMANAYLTTDARGLEITKRISLAELDPVALLHLKSTGTCEFALTEAYFDYDFPGHYRRQIRWLSVDFVDAAGEPTTPNAVLTQLNHKTVLRPDTAAVKYLLDPKGSPPAALRSDWRPRQQVALSTGGGGGGEQRPVPAQPRRRPVPAVRGHRRGFHMAPGVAGPTFGRRPRRGSATSFSPCATPRTAATQRSPTPSRACSSRTRLSATSTSRQSSRTPGPSSSTATTANWCSRSRRTCSRAWRAARSRRSTAGSTSPRAAR